MGSRSLISFLFTVLLIPTLAVAAEITVPFTKVPNQPYFQSAQLTADSMEYNTLILTLSSPQSGTARLYWANHYDPQFNQSKNLWFFVKPGIHDYYFNIASQSQNWIGWTKALLVMPDFPINGFEIGQAKLVTGGFGTDLASGWQEFWGPNGRVVIGSTINLIPSSAIWGQSINIYIYWLTGVLFIGALCWFLYKELTNNKKAKSKDFYAVYLAAGRWTICFALAAWFILTLNSYVNYISIARDNFGKYYGKSLAQKQAVAYGQDYYDFLAFAQVKLPKEPVYFGVISSRYMPDLQARILLIPHILTDPRSPNADYLLVINPEPKQLSQISGFAMFAKFNQNAFILKRTR
jgi:hypothetical protein